MISDEYQEYLHSERWQQLRSIRLKIDGYKCQRCGRPFDLQVHHLNYPEVLGTEDPYTDLITVCKPCHEEIESGKAEYRKDAYKKRKDLQMKMFYRIVADHARDDLSNVGIGKRDYCNLDHIKEDFGPIMEEMEFEFGYAMRIQDYFRNRRYEIILDMLAHGYNPWIIYCQTLFSYRMIKKVAANPEKAKEILEREKKNNE